MISWIRRKFKSRQSQAIIWISLLALMFFFSPELMRRFFTTADWVAKVNGIGISREQYNHKVEESRRSLESLKHHPLFASFFKNYDPKEIAFKGLINEALLNKEIERLNIQFDSEYIKQQAIKMLPPEALDASGQIDMETLSRIYGFSSVAEFERDVKNNIKTKLAMDLTRGAIYIPDFLVKNDFNKMYSKRKYSVLIFPFSKYLSEVKNTPLTIDEVRRYFDEQNRKEKKYWVPEKRAGIMWEFKPEAYGIKTNDKEIEAYYNKNRRAQFVANEPKTAVRRILIKKDVKNPAESMQKAQKIRNDLLKDKSKFAEFATKYSQDENSASKGGMIEFVKGKQELAFERNASYLKNSGDISEVFESSQGYEILQLVDKKPLAFKKLEDVKNQIKQLLEKEKFKKLFLLDTRHFLGSEQNSAGFEEFAKKKEGKQKDTPIMTNDNSLFAQKLFGIRNEKEMAFYVEDNKAYAIKLTTLQRSYVPKLETVQKTIEEDLYKQKAAEKLKRQLELAKKEAATKNFEQIKESFGVELKTTPSINSEDEKEIKDLQKENINAQNLLELDKEGAVSDYIGQKDGYLFKVTYLEPFNKEKYEAKKGSIEHRIAMNKLQELELEFIASLKKNAKIDIIDKKLKQIKL